MVLDEKRQGEIALIILKDIYFHKGIMISLQSKREFKEKSKKLGIPLEEMKAFALPIVTELVTKVFGPEEKS